MLRVGGATRADQGFATPVEMMVLVTFCLAAVLVIGYLGRLHAAGVQVTNAAQSAARAASIATTPSEARVVATDSATTALDGRCLEPPVVRTTWTASAAGTWRGGSVTVLVSCRVGHDELSGMWAPGSRTVTMSDTQPIDRYRR